MSIKYFLICSCLLLTQCKTSKVRKPNSFSDQGGFDIKSFLLTGSNPTSKIKAISADQITPTVFNVDKDTAHIIIRVNEDNPAIAYHKLELSFTHDGKTCVLPSKNTSTFMEEFPLHPKVNCNNSGTQVSMRGRFGVRAQACQLIAGGTVTKEGSAGSCSPWSPYVHFNINSANRRLNPNIDKHLKNTAALHNFVNTHLLASATRFKSSFEQKYSKTPPFEGAPRNEQLLYAIAYNTVKDPMTMAAIYSTPVFEELLEDAESVSEKPQTVLSLVDTNSNLEAVPSVTDKPSCEISVEFEWVVNNGKGSCFKKTTQGQTQAQGSQEQAQTQAGADNDVVEIPIHKRWINEKSLWGGLIFTGSLVAGSAMVIDQKLGSGYKQKKIEIFNRRIDGFTAKLDISNYELAKEQKRHVDSLKTSNNNIRIVHDPIEKKFFVFDGASKVKFNGSPIEVKKFSNKKAVESKKLFKTGGILMTAISGLAIWTYGVSNYSLTAGSDWDTILSTWILDLNTAEEELAKLKAEYWKNQNLLFGIE